MEAFKIKSLYLSVDPNEVDLHTPYGEETQNAVRYDNASYQLMTDDDNTLKLEVNGHVISNNDILNIVPTYEKRDSDIYVTLDVYDIDSNDKVFQFYVSLPFRSDDITSLPIGYRNENETEMFSNNENTIYTYDIELAPVSPKRTIEDDLNDIKGGSFKTLRLFGVLFQHFVDNFNAGATLAGNVLVFFLLPGLLSSWVSHIFDVGTASPLAIIVFVIGLGLMYILYEKVLTDMTIEIYQESSHKMANYFSEFLNDDDWIYSPKTRNAMHTLNAIVELENDPNVAHHIHEFIDVSKSTERHLFIDFGAYGSIIERVNIDVEDSDLTAKQFAMRNHVVTEPMSHEELLNIQSLVKQYQDTISNIEYQRDYERYDEAFKNKTMSRKTQLEKSLDTLNQDLKRHDEELEQFKQAKIKDIDNRIH